MNKFGPEDTVRIQMFDFSGQSRDCGYAYGTVTFKCDETDNLYWIQFREGGSIRVHENHLALCSNIERLLYF